MVSWLAFFETEVLKAYKPTKLTLDTPSHMVTVSFLLGLHAGFRVAGISSRPGWRSKKDLHPVHKASGDALNSYGRPQNGRRQGPFFVCSLEGL